MEKQPQEMEETNSSISSISLISNSTVSKVEFLKLMSSLFTNLHKRQEKNQSVSHYCKK